MDLFFDYDKAHLHEAAVSLAIFVFSLDSVSKCPGRRAQIGNLQRMPEFKCVCVKIMSDPNKEKLSCTNRTGLLQR